MAPAGLSSCPILHTQNLITFLKISLGSELCDLYYGTKTSTYFLQTDNPIFCDNLNSLYKI